MKNNFLSYKAIKNIYRIFKRNFSQRFDVFFKIFGYSLVAAVVASVLLVLIAKYFFYAVSFFIGIVVSATITNNTDFLWKKITDLIEWSILKIKRWLFDLCHLDHI